MAILLQEAAEHKVGERAIWVFSFMSNCTKSTDLISCLLTDVSLFTPCPCLWVSPLISNRIHWGLPSFSCSGLFTQEPVMLITGSHVKFSYQSIIYSLNPKGTISVLRWQQADLSYKKNSSHTFKGEIQPRNKPPVLGITGKNLQSQIPAFIILCFHRFHIELLSIYSAAENL